MKRRQFLKAFGGTASAAVVALEARAQQTTMPVIGFLDTRSPELFVDRLRRFRQGLKESGYIEGENVTIDYRWAENQRDRIPAQAADLARKGVAVILASGGPFVALAAKAATTTIPIVFLATEDPVKLGLVANLARPGGNLTGINFFSSELTAKRLELLRALVPAAARVAVLVNPVNATGTENTLRDVQVAARAVGMQIQVLNASTIGEIDAAFATMAHDRPEALFVGTDSFFQSRRLQLSLSAMRHAVPATFSGREYAEVGGLMSYGSNAADAYRQAGGYVGRILKGARPADLPVEQSSKFEMVINGQTARLLGVTVPATLLATADEIIE
ncbi:MAG: ABC transporter substrate-binding protein [Xanthobacteraceae bacterium]